jgi:hypothetical protein
VRRDGYQLREAGRTLSPPPISRRPSADSCMALSLSPHSALATCLQAPDVSWGVSVLDSEAAPCKQERNMRVPQAAQCLLALQVCQL